MYDLNRKRLGNFFKILVLLACEAQCSAWGGPALNGSTKLGIGKSDVRMVAVYPDQRDCSRWFYEMDRVVSRANSPAKQGFSIVRELNKSLFALSVYDFEVASLPLGPEGETQLSSQIVSWIKQRTAIKDPNFSQCRPEAAITLRPLLTTLTDPKIDPSFANKGAQLNVQAQEAQTDAPWTVREWAAIRLAIDAGNPAAEPQTSMQLSQSEIGDITLAQIHTQSESLFKINQIQLRVNRTDQLAVFKGKLAGLKCRLKPNATGENFTTSDRLTEVLLTRSSESEDQLPTRGSRSGDKDQGGNSIPDCSDLISPSVHKIARGCVALAATDQTPPCNDTFEYIDWTPDTTQAPFLYQAPLFKQWVEENYQIQEKDGVIYMKELELIKTGTSLYSVKSVGEMVSPASRELSIKVHPMDPSEIDLTALDRPQMKCQRLKFAERSSLFPDESQADHPIPLVLDLCK